MSANDPLGRVAALLGRLPGLGPKSAMRVSLALARSDHNYLEALCASIDSLRTNLRLCSLCCDFSTEVQCSICSDTKREGQTICVVAQPQDRVAIERTRAFRGRYHVLHGLLDPLPGVGPAELKIEPLLRRFEAGETQEVILATSPSVEGDATALYLARLLTPLGVRVSRIASGVAVGGELEYADSTTLLRAFEDRRQL